MLTDMSGLLSEIGTDVIGRHQVDQAGGCVMLHHAADVPLHGEAVEEDPVRTENAQQLQPLHQSDRQVGVREVQALGQGNDRFFAQGAGREISQRMVCKKRRQQPNVCNICGVSP